jgi:hypothetical protein
MAAKIGVARPTTQFRLRMMSSTPRPAERTDSAGPDSG